MELIFLGLKEQEFLQNNKRQEYVHCLLGVNVFTLLKKFQLFDL